MATGRDYLHLRRRRATDREGARQEAERVAEVLHCALSGHAEGARVHEPQSRQLSNTPDRNTFNAAYLVPHEQSPSFVERVSRLTETDPNVRAEVTGPWAPYSFVEEVQER